MAASRKKKIERVPAGDPLKVIRDQIDAIDNRMLDLLSRRARLAMEIGKAKKGPKYRPEREAQILTRLSKNSRGPLSGQSLRLIYTEVMSACRSLEDGVTVAYMGPPGTYSQEATLKQFGSETKLMPGSSIDEVFRMVETGQAGYGVVPAENSTEGSVGRTQDLLLATPLKICGEILLPVHHCFMSKSGKGGQVKKVLSHSQSLGQCHKWLTNHYPNAKRISVVSNAEAARLAIADPAAAAIAGKVAAELYQLKIIAANIEDEPQNTTRFIVIAPHDARPSGKDKTSLIMSAQNIPGAMYALLAPLARYDVSMTRLESRPSRLGQWEYFFYVDIEGHNEDAKVNRALKMLETKASFFKNLGSYPAAVV